MELAQEWQKRPIVAGTQHPKLEFSVAHYGLPVPTQQWKKMIQASEHQHQLQMAANNTASINPNGRVWSHQRHHQRVEKWGQKGCLPNVPPCPYTGPMWRFQPRSVHVFQEPENGTLS